jgi:NAD(P)-dependent dehydrogenase (short-subunit alcohol dehydrogenase family)
MNRILITGANRGVGLELARQCTARGDRVFTGCRSPEKTAALEELAIQYPGKVTILPLDVTNESSIASSAKLVAAETEAIDILFNNAAIFSHGEPIKSFSADEAINMLNVNAVGQMLMAKHFLDLLKAGDESKIINISSEAGSISRMTGFRGYYYYGSKALLNMYTRALAWDDQTQGITVIAIHPGWVRTDMGGPDAHISPTQSAKGLLKVTEGLTTVDNGKFYTWDGDEYPW